MKEIWKKINGFEGYEISNTGLVKSINRKVLRFNGNIVHYKTVRERILKPGLNENGYNHITLRKNGKAYTKTIHKLVASHFVKGYILGLIVHHKDGNKLNNNSNNLEFTSRQNNTQLYYNSIGKSNGKVPILDIPIIIERIKKGEKCYNIANEYNVSRNDIAVLCKIILLTGKELEIK